MNAISISWIYKRVEDILFLYLIVGEEEEIMLHLHVDENSMVIILWVVEIEWHDEHVLHEVSWCLEVGLLIVLLIALVVHLYIF